MLEFVFVLRCHDDDVRDGAEEGDVEQAVVGRAVGSHEASPVHRQDHRQFLQADVVDDLVVGPLQEGGIDRHDGDESLGGEPRRKGHAVLFGHSHVVEPSGKFAGETVQPRPSAHRRRDGHDLRVLVARGTAVRPKTDV